MATYSSILAWKIPWTGEPGGLQSVGSQELDMTEHRAHTHSISIKIKMCILFDPITQLSLF